MGYPKVSLKAVNKTNYRDCVKLRVAESQAAWVAPNMESLAWAYVNRRLTPLAIYDGELIVSDLGPEDRMVGFVMYQVWDEVGFIMRLMIGEEFQRRGYARAAMDEVVRRLRMIPEVRFIGTSVIPENEAATRLYLGMGFVDAKWPPEDPKGERYLMLDCPE